VYGLCLLYAHVRQSVLPFVSWALLLVACLPPPLEVATSDASAAGEDDVVVDSEPPAEGGCIPKCANNVCDVSDGCGGVCQCRIEIMCVNKICPL
jgi:hypothetical protein